MTVGERLKYLRELKEYTQKDVANALGLESAAISKYEYGLREPNMDSLKKLATLFEVSTDYLLGLTPDMFRGENEMVQFKIEPVVEKFNSLKDDFNVKSIVTNDIYLGAVLNELCCTVGRNSFGNVEMYKTVNISNIDNILNNFDNADYPIPQLSFEFDFSNDTIMIIEVDDMTDTALPLNAKERTIAYTYKLSKKYNVLAISMSVDEKENIRLTNSFYMSKKSDKYIPLLLPRTTILSAGEYVEILKRLM
ncbi:MAG: helix-turn-helix transcriptional regulator [Clostridia bacterium]